MNLRSSSRMVCAFSLMILILLRTTPSRGQSASSQPTLSVIADGAPGPVAKHGLNKLFSALKTQGVTVEQANDLQAARGKVLLVAGSATGSGRAAEMIKSFRVPAPQEAESLLIRHTQWNGKKAE